MMFCGKCGKNIQDNAGFCPYCGAKTKYAQGAGMGMPNKENRIYNTDFLTDTESDSSLRLKKCAWFAPVSVILSAVITQLIYNFAVTSKIGLRVILYILEVIAPLVISVIVFLIAVSKVDRKIKAQIFPFALIPVLFTEFPANIESLLNLIIMDNFQRTEEIITIIKILSAIFAIIMAVICFLIISKAFGAVENNHTNKSQ